VLISSKFPHKTNRASADSKRLIHFSVKSRSCARHQTIATQDRQCQKSNQFNCGECFTKRTDAFACKFKSYDCQAFIEKDEHIVEQSNKVDIFIGKTRHTVCMFCHGRTHLLPQVHRNMHCRDGTRRGKHHFVPILCSGSNLVFFPLGCTAVPGLEIGTRL